MFFCSNITPRSLQSSTLFFSYSSLLTSHLFFSSCQQSHQHPFSFGQNMFFISASFLNAQSWGCFSFQFSVFTSDHSGSGGGLLALKPMLLISDDTAAAPAAVFSLRSGNLSRKRRREKQSWWGLGRRLATRLKRGTENGSCQEMWHWRRAGEVQTTPPAHQRPVPSEDFVTCGRYSWSSD